MTREAAIGKIKIGGGNRVAVQSMVNVKTSKVGEVVKQILALEDLGCDIIRVSVKDDEDVNALADIKKSINIPLVADIHFNYKYALRAIDNGVDKIRINPGNIGSEKNVEEVARAVKSSGVAVRVGSNTGSVEKELLAKYGKNEISLAESALTRGYTRTNDSYALWQIVHCARSCLWQMGERRNSREPFVNG